MSKGTYKRVTLFSGFGIGAGLGLGCGLGAGSGVGGEAPRPQTPHGSVAGAGAGAPFAGLPHSHFLARARQLLRGPTPVSATPLVRHELAQTVAVKFVWDRPAVRSVFLAGTFNDWGLPAAMWRRVGAGGRGGAGEVWETVLRLGPGTYDYKYVVDGEWRLDSNTLTASVPEHGAVNRLIVDAGGGCGFGLGAGWGFFAVGVGVVVKGMNELSGRTRRQLNRYARQLELEREAGLRPPRRNRSVEESGIDPLLDRIIRHVESRRAMRRLSNGAP